MVIKLKIFNSTYISPLIPFEITNYNIYLWSKLPQLLNGTAGSSKARGHGFEPQPDNIHYFRKIQKLLPCLALFIKRV